MGRPTTINCTAAVLAAVLLSGAAQGQRRESLSDRLARLETQVATLNNDEASDTLADLVIQMGELQAEVRELRGLIEEQSFALESLRKSQLDQYLDLDGRLVQTERRIAGSTATQAQPQGSDNGNSGWGTRPVDPPTRIDSEPPSQEVTQAPTAGDFPEVREPIDAQLETSGIGSAPPTQVVVRTDPAAEKAAYDEAFDALRNGRYSEASRLFDSFLQQFPSGEYADNAQYWLGESYYVTRNYRVALEAFQTLLSRYPESSKVPDARLKIGLSYYSLKNWPAAEQELNAVIEAYPDSTVSRLAQNRLRAMRIEGYIQ